MRVLPAFGVLSSEVSRHASTSTIIGESDWHFVFETAYHDAADRQRTCFPASGQELVDAAWPLVEVACVPVAEQVLALHTAGIVGAADVQTFYAGLTAPLWQRLFSTMAQTLVLELAAAQETGLLPHGGTESDAYDFFASCLADPQFALAILRQHDGPPAVQGSGSSGWRASGRSGAAP